MLKWTTIIAVTCVYLWFEILNISCPISYDNWVLILSNALYGVLGNFHIHCKQIIVIEASIVAVNGHKFSKNLKSLVRYLKRSIMKSYKMRPFFISYSVNFKSILQVSWITVVFTTMVIDQYSRFHQANMTNCRVRSNFIYFLCFVVWSAPGELKNIVRQKIEWWNIADTESQTFTTTTKQQFSPYSLTFLWHLSHCFVLLTVMMWQEIYSALLRFGLNRSRLYNIKKYCMSVHINNVLPHHVLYGYREPGQHVIMISHLWLRDAVMPVSLLMGQNIDLYHRK